MFSLTISEGVDLITVDKSSIPEFDFGVWSRSTITPNTLFGPYKEETPVEEVCDNINLEVKQEEPEQKPDVSKLLESNWVKYLNCAKNCEEENMVAVKKKGLLFYRVTKNIPPKTELLVNKCLRGDCWKQHDLDPSSSSGDDESSEPVGISLKSVKRRESEAVPSDDDFDTGHQSDSFDDEDDEDNEPGYTIGYLKNFNKKKCITKPDSKARRKPPLKNILNTSEEADQNKKPFACTLCEMSFNSRSRLTRHTRSHTGEKPYPCSMCELSFASSQGRKRHMNVHIIEPEKSHSCDICKASFARKEYLRRHLKTHSGVRPFSCSVCDRSFVKSTTLKRHMQTHTGEKPYSCTECGISYADMCTLKSHIESHGVEKPYCPQCNKTFLKQSRLEEHMLKHTGVKPFDCEECGKAYTHALSLIRHQRSLHSKLKVEKKESEVDEKPLICKICGAALKTAGTLKMHMRIHTDEKPHLCSLCGLSFNRKNSLTRHMVTHTGERAYACDFCPKRYCRSSELERHRLYKHLGGVKNHVCKTCGYKTYSSTLLKVHNRTHTGEKPFPCPDCDSAFPTRKHLKVHMSKHLLETTGEKAFACDLCEKRYARSADLSRHKLYQHLGGERTRICETCGYKTNCSYRLKIHIRTHTGEKPFPCTECELAFPTKKQLRSHMNTHAGVKHYICNECGVQFANRHGLKRHLITHTGERPHSCEFCGRAFALKSTLTRHRRTHTGEKPYACHVCGALYAVSYALLYHMRTHTGEKPYECKECDAAFIDCRKLKNHMKTHFMPQFV